MKFTFGIITPGGAESNIKEIIKSIDTEFGGEIDRYEIIIVGGVDEYYERDNLIRVPFDEKKKPGWITRKKNMITELAKFDNIVYMHDYIRLESGWLEGFEEFGDDWDVCMNKIVGMDNSRFRDFCYWDKPGIGEPWTCNEFWCPKGGLHFDGKAALAPYTEIDTSRMYVSGTYWVAKASFMRRFRLNEKIMHCQGEDCEFSIRARPFWKYKMNTNSTVRLMKPKELGIIPCQSS